MQSSSLVRPLAALCFALALVVQAISYDRPAVAAPMNSVVGNLSDFYSDGNSGTLDIEKGGETMHFTFGGGMTINGQPWMSGGQTAEPWGGSMPSSLKLHCTLVRVYYTGGFQHVATALKTISNGGSRFFC